MHYLGNAGPGVRFCSSTILPLVKSGFAVEQYCSWTSVLRNDDYFSLRSHFGSIISACLSSGLAFYGRYRVLYTSWHAMYTRMTRPLSRSPFFYPSHPPPLQLREDLGDIRFTPTFVFAFFNDDGTQYAKFEGESEIMSAVDSGRIDAVIKELMSRRTKLKMVDGMAELAAKMMVMKLVGAMAEDSSEKEERGRTVCELCKGSFPNPVTYHMKAAHPGCGRGCGASGYNATGAYSKSGWLGDCGDGGRGMSTWYLMCKECRAKYLAGDKSTRGDNCTMQ